MVNFVGVGICLRASVRATVYALMIGKYFFSATPTLHYSSERTSRAAALTVFVYGTNVGSCGNRIELVDTCNVKYLCGGDSEGWVEAERSRHLDTTTVPLNPALSLFLFHGKTGGQNFTKITRARDFARHR
jgi:hypothetical protein